MGKREDERGAKLQQERRGVERYWKAIRDEFEAEFAAPDSDYDIALYRRVMHKAIMHFAMRAMRESDYSHGYRIGETQFDIAAKLIERQAKLALAAHKVELDNAKLERALSDTGRRRSHANNASKIWDQPHASHFKPEKRPQFGAGSSSDVRLPALQSADADGDGVP